MNHVQKNCNPLLMGAVDQIFCDAIDLNLFKNSKQFDSLSAVLDKQCPPFIHTFRTLSLSIDKRLNEKYKVKNEKLLQENEEKHKLETEKLIQENKILKSRIAK